MSDEGTWVDAILIDPDTKRMYVFGELVPVIDDRIPPEILIEELREDACWSAKLSWEQTRLWESKPSGLADGGLITVVGTNLVVAAGTGIITDSYSLPAATVTQELIQWDEQTVPIQFPADFQSTVSINNLGVVVQRNRQLTPPEKRDEIYLGFLTKQLDGTYRARPNPIVINSVAHASYDYMQEVGGLYRIESGLEVTEKSTLQLIISDGVIWSLNLNWHTNRKDPNRQAVPGSDPVQFQYITGDGTLQGAFPTVTINPQIYNPGGGGTVSPVPGGSKATTIQRLYADVGGNDFILLGQNVYANFLEAEAAILADQDNTIIPEHLGGESYFYGWIVVERGATDWDPAEAAFIPSSIANAAGSGGAPVESFLDLTDTPSGYGGAGGYTVRVNSAENALEFVNDVHKFGQSGTSYFAPLKNGVFTYTQVGNIPGLLPSANYLITGSVTARHLLATATAPTSRALVQARGATTVNSNRIQLPWMAAENGQQKLGTVPFAMIVQADVSGIIAIFLGEDIAPGVDDSVYAYEGIFAGIAIPSP